MQRIESLINYSIKKHKLDSKVKEYRIHHDWEHVINNFLPDAAGKTMIVSLQNGILHIASLSKEIADQITVYQKRLIYELNERAGKDLIFRIHCEY